MWRLWSGFLHLLRCVCRNRGRFLFPLTVECDCDVGCDAGRSRGDGVDAHTYHRAGFAGVVVDVFAVGVDVFGGVDFVPGVAAVEAGFEGHSEVGAAGCFEGEGEFGGVAEDAEFVVEGGHRSTRVFDDVGVALGLDDVYEGHYFLPLGLRFLAVLAESLKSLAVGAPFAPGLRIFSPEPAAMRFRLAFMLAYRPRFLGMDLAVFDPMLLLFTALAFGLFLTAVAVMSGH